MRLSDQLKIVREKRFTGRNRECKLFQSILTNEKNQPNIIFIYGSVGVGKSFLLKKFQSYCEELQIEFTYIDCRNVGPTTDEFINATAENLVVPEKQILSDFLSHSPKRVICFDAFETLNQLETWIWQGFLPLLSSEIITIFSGRFKSSNIQIEKGEWKSLILPIHLKNFNFEESADYLNKRHIETTQYENIYKFSNGHPLTLSLIADLYENRHDLKFKPENHPELINKITSLFYDKVINSTHRKVIEICSLLYVTTESILKEILEVEDSHPLFYWLNDLFFIHSGKRGLFPENLVRESILPELLWRNREWYEEIRLRASNYYKFRITSTTGQDIVDSLFDLLYLNKNNHNINEFFDWNYNEEISCTDLTITDFNNLADFYLRLGENGKSKNAIRSAIQAGTLKSIKDKDGKILGVFEAVLSNDLQQNSDGFINAKKYLLFHAPLRKEELAIFIKYWINEEEEKIVDPVQTKIFLNIFKLLLKVKHLAYTFIAVPEPNFWQPFFKSINFKRIKELDFFKNENEFGIFGHDWRIDPLSAFLDSLISSQANSLAEDTKNSSTERLIIFSKEDFEKAIKDVLHNLNRPQKLIENPIIYSKIISDGVKADAGAKERIDFLIEMVRELIESIRVLPKHEKFYQVLLKTYVLPMESQEKAADTLDISFSTFRRYLKTGVNLLVDLLWNKEVV